MFDCLLDREIISQLNLYHYFYYCHRCYLIRIFYCYLLLMNVGRLLRIFNIALSKKINMGVCLCVCVGAGTSEPGSGGGEVEV